MPANPYAALRDARCELTWGRSRLWWEMAGPCSFAVTYRNGLHEHRRHFEICCMLAGRGVQTHTDQTAELRPGDLFLARPGFVHEIISEREPAIELVFFNLGVIEFEPADGSIEGRLLKRFLTGAGIHSRGGDLVAAQLATLARSLEARAADQDLMLEAAVRAILCEVLRRIGSLPDPAAAPADPLAPSAPSTPATPAAPAAPSDRAPPSAVETGAGWSAAAVNLREFHQAPQPDRRETLTLSASGADGNALPGPGPSRALEQALRFLDDNLARPISCRELARQAGVSERSLRRLFEDHLRTTPGREYLTRRMRWAAQLLADPRQSVHAVGARIGIPDPSQFSRDFRRVMGRTPSQFRAEHTRRVTWPQSHLE
ncbi:MAG: AraC family transcriptional regulator [Planctomycetota bacterium]